MNASQIAGDPDLFNEVVRLPRSREEWECIGYSRTGNTVKFARLIDGGQLRDRTPWPRQITRYVDPNTPITITSKKDRTE